MTWSCNFTPLAIRVNNYANFIGWYNFLEEPFCHKCSSPGVETNDCRLKDKVYGFNRVYALGKYVSYKRDPKDLLSKHIRYLKYFKKEKLAIPLGTALYLFVEHKYPDLLEADYVVPVPTTDAQIKIRDIDHTKLISNTYCEQANQTQLNCLKKVKESSFAKEGYGIQRRYREVKGMFEYIPFFEETLKDKYVLLVDDVVTCCSQSSECSKILMDHGVEKVDILTLGRNALDETP